MSYFVHNAADSTLKPCKQVRYHFVLCNKHEFLSLNCRFCPTPSGTRHPPCGCSSRCIPPQHLDQPSRYLFIRVQQAKYNPAIARQETRLPKAYCPESLYFRNAVLLFWRWKFASVRSRRFCELPVYGNLLHQHQWSKKYPFLNIVEITLTLDGQMQICAGEIDFTGPVTININIGKRR